MAIISITEFLNNLGTDYLVVLVYVPIVCAFILYGTLPWFKGHKKLIVSVLTISVLFDYILLPIFGIRSLIINNQKNDIIYVVITIFFFGVFIYRLLKKKIIYSWINDDIKYKELTTPKDGRNIHMDISHPIRLTIEASWIFGYFVLFLVGIIYTIVGHLLGWGFIQKIFLIFLAGVMFFAHVILVSFEKCPYCRFYVFDLEKEHKSKLHYFLVVAYQIIFKRAFHCMHCGAYFTVKKLYDNNLNDNNSTVNR